MTESSPARKSCVVISAFAPDPSMAGSHMRVAGTILALNHDFDVHVIFTDNRPPMISRAKDFCRNNGISYTHDPRAFGLGKRVSLTGTIRFAIGCLSPRFEVMSVRRIPSHTRHTLQSADIIWIYRQSTFRFRSLPSDLESHVIVDVDDIEERVISQRTDYPRWLRSLMVRKTRFSRQRLLGSAHIALLCSDLDARRLEAPCPKAVLQNSYPVPIVQQQSNRDSRHAVMIGMMSYFPNRDGIQWFLEEVWDRVRQQIPDAQLTIAGRASDELFAPDPGRGIDVIGSFENPTPLLEKATVSIVPLRHGSGTRIKILEAFAHSVPVVSTSIGAEGLEATDGESILLADDPAEFAQHVIALFENPKLANRIAAAGNELFHAKYSPEMFALTVLEIIRESTKSDPS
jgi:glycosyltransferase involved in cell wall biosynthesis